MDETEGNGRGREVEKNKVYLKPHCRKRKHLDLLRSVGSKAIYCPGRVRMVKAKRLRQPETYPTEDHH